MTAATADTGTGPSLPIGETDPAVVAAFQATALHRDLGATIETRENGVLLRARVGDRFARGDGLSVMHGGGIATLLDSATVWAAVTVTQRLWATADLRVDYLRPVRLGEVEVVANLLQVGSTIARSCAELRDSTGRVAATAVATLVADKAKISPPSDASAAPNSQHPDTTARPVETAAE